MKLNHPLKTLLTLTVAASFFALFETADAHGYISSPRSRNYYAYTEAKWWDVNENDPEPESDPFSLNRGGTAAQCGMVGDRNYDLPKNALGGLMKPTIQECYNAGSIIDISVTLTAYHGGHFEFHACPINHGEIPTESCFKDHPLEFVEDVLNGAPKDPNYPSRAYIHGLTSMTLGEFKYKYKLPDNLIGELVLIQWYYVTGNTCTDEGYADYPFPAGFTPYNAGDATTATCPLPITGDGSEAPERFWNCAEVRITEDCSITTTSTTTPATVCTPIPQSELGYAVTAVSQSQCDKCAQNNHESQYWPCDSSPPLCDCGLEPGSTTTAATTTTTTTAASTTTTTTSTTTTTTPPPQSPSPIPNPSKAPITNAPTSLPTQVPTADPSEAPTKQPSNTPTSLSPTESPSKSPTAAPTQKPTDQPTSSPTTSAPTQPPTTANLTGAPTKQPSNPPTSLSPTKPPSKGPTASPTQKPTDQPTSSPTTSAPTQPPTTANPTENPTNQPTNEPTTATPTQFPTNQPTNLPNTTSPTPVPTHPPTKQPVPGSTGWYVDGDKCVLGEPSTETLYPSASSCCNAQLSWISNELCESRSAGVPTMKFYADQTASMCRQDCSTTNGLPCGGSPQDTSLELYSSLESCCAAKIGWEPSCVDKSNGNEPQGTNRYYVNWELMKCALDCPEGSSDGCGGVAKSWDTTYGTSASCCAAISWVDSAQCVYGATTTTTTSTSKPTANDTAGTTCRAKTMQEIANGAWPITDGACKVCEGEYTWWPCGTFGLCQCD